MARKHGRLPKRIVQNAINAVLESGLEVRAVEVATIGDDIKVTVFPGKPGVRDDVSPVNDLDRWIANHENETEGN